MDSSFEESANLEHDLTETALLAFKDQLPNDDKSKEDLDGWIAFLDQSTISDPDVTAVPSYESITYPENDTNGELASAEKSQAAETQFSDIMLTQDGEVSFSGLFTDSPLAIDAEQDGITLTDPGIVGLPGSADNILSEFDLSNYIDPTLNDFDLEAETLPMDVDHGIGNIENSNELAELYPSTKDNVEESGLPLYWNEFDVGGPNSNTIEQDYLISKSGIYPQVNNSLNNHYPCSVQAYNQEQEPYYIPGPLYVPQKYGLRAPQAIAYTAPGAAIIAENKRRYTFQSDSASEEDRRHPKQPRLNNFEAERPKHDPSHAWVKHNPHARGSTRTGKINQYNAADFYGEPKCSPYGSWTSPNGKHRFDYNRYGEIDEPTLSTRQIKEFIYNHPGKLTMLIQKCPSDSARRYPTSTLPVCRFEKCPSRMLGYNGKIQPGHYRVSFDEKYAVHGTKSDPYHVAFNCHLYCVERFLNFPELCATQNVQVERRGFYATEPRGRFNGEIQGRDGDVADKFIERCREGLLEQKYPHYPRREDWEADQHAAHLSTLNRLVQQAGHEGKSANRQEFLKAQGTKGSNIVVHMGDIIMQLQSKVDSRMKSREAKKQVRFSDSGKRRRGSSSTDMDDFSDSSEEPMEDRRKKARAYY